MTYSILSAKGRLSRRDFALTIGTILGGAALAAFAVLFLILPIVFLFVSAFFRDTTTAFWILLIWGILLALCALYAVLPLISIPAAVRRLHDLGRSGYFALPLVLNGFIALGFPILIFLSFIGMAEEITGIRILRQARRKFGHSSVSTGRKTRGDTRRTMCAARNGRSRGK